MLRNLKFPLIYVLEVLLWLPLIAAFYATVSFLAAQPIDTLGLSGRSLPAGWEAAVPNHGKFLEGYLIANHPIAFAFAGIVLFGSAFLLYLVHRAEATQRIEAGSSGTTRHKVAQACVFALLAAIGYFLVTHVLVGVSAA